MMKRILLSIAGLLFVTGLSFGQNEVDALRYSQTYPVGTARSAAMGGAFGALGADFSSISTNPAGLGLYRSSEFVFSPQLYFSDVNTSYNGMLRDDSDINFNFGNIGMVLTEEIPNRLDKPGWRFMQFGVGINRMNNFHERVMIQGENTMNSRTDVYAALANGIAPSQIEQSGNYAFDLTPAWNAFAIDLADSASNTYFTYAPAGGVLQKDQIERWGSMSEISIAMGANYNDRFYVGASVGFPYVRYQHQRTYTETKLQDDAVTNEFREFTVYEELITRGTGFNFKIGMIYKPVEWLRVGGAFHTPTWFAGLTDEWDVSMETTFDTPDSQGNYDYFDSSPTGTYDYDLKTPLKAMGNVAFIIGTNGVVSADYQYINYSNARLRAPDYDFDPENESIKNKYRGTHNLQLGTEWRYTNFNFRGGLALYQSPYEDDINDGARTYYSFGAGYRFPKAFIDLAWIHMNSEEDYYMYGYEDIQVNAAQIERSTNRFMATVGFRF